MAKQFFKEVTKENLHLGGISAIFEHSLRDIFTMKPAKSIVHSYGNNYNPAK